MSDGRIIFISALQHYAFCKRQCALIHNEQLWEENWLTAQGQVLHQRVDSKEPETRRGTRYERTVEVFAPKLGLSGKLDLLEQNIKTGELKPVEYKRGKPKTHDADLVQLCAQVLCLEEMTGKEIKVASLWYWQTRKRIDVEIDAKLRSRTLSLIKEIHTLLDSDNLPEPILTKSCKACSLIDICLPKIHSKQDMATYLKFLYEDDE